MKRKIIVACGGAVEFPRVRHLRPVAAPQRGRVKEVTDCIVRNLFLLCAGQPPSRPHREMIPGMVTADKMVDTAIARVENR